MLVSFAPPGQTQMLRLLQGQQERLLDLASESRRSAEPQPAQLHRRARRWLHGDNGPRFAWLVRLTTF